MQRIDENTYIDDTLVTCAEYQLFIDEMREQGKFYQPDHWTLYQFPEGKAREPIVGVRFSDAQAFSDWLTSRLSGEWRYRIPNYGELFRHPIVNIYPFPVGFWFTDKKRKDSIGIAGQNRKESNGNVIKWVLNESIKNAAERLRWIDINRRRNIGGNVDRELDGGRAIMHATDIKLVNNDRYRNIHVDSICSRAKELDPLLGMLCQLSLERNLDSDRMFKQGMSDAIGVDDILGLAQSMKISEFCTHAQAVDLSVNYTCELSVERIAHEPSLATVDMLDALGLNLTIELDNLLGLIVDLITISERISGRSPAFEGIRLVKERIR
jgi:hypothetical protein